MKNQKSTNVGVAPLKMNGQLVAEPREKAEVLNSQFQSAFSEGKTYSYEEFTEKCEMTDKDLPKLDSVNITEKGVRQLLEKLDPAKASGPDNISARVLKELSSEIDPILTTIYRSSLDSGCVPTDWKSALVTPIFKKGEHYKPANYRPVSLTCIACKVLEHIIVHATMNHLDSRRKQNPVYTATWFQTAKILRDPAHRA